MAKKKQLINLLPREGFDTTFQGRALAWALSSFRIIVIVTELVVMTAFLSRFFLDAQNSDLSEEIQQKQSLISANQSFEKEFKAVQNKLDLYKTVTSSKINSADVIEAVVNSLPGDVYLDSIVIAGNNISVIGVSSNTQSVQQFIVNLESKDPVSSVNLGSVEKGSVDSDLIKFSVGGQI